MVAVLAIGFGHDLVDSRALRRTVMDAHRAMGLAIAGLTLARLWLRGARPWPEADAPALLRVAAKLSHLALYGLLFGLPLLGLVQTGAAKAHPTLFGVVPLPSFTGQDRDLADTLAEWHERGAWALIGLIGLHAAAALWHHYVRGDAVLARMAPALRRTRVAESQVRSL